MQYAEALALAKATIVSPVEPRRTKVLSNTRTDAFCTYLKAFAFEARLNLDVEPPTYASLFAEAARGGDTAVAWVALEDIFPEFSFRSASEWSASAVAEAIAGRDERIASFCDTLASALEGRWHRALIVPPFLEPPALTPARKHLLSMEAALLDATRYALSVRFSAVENAEVLDSARILEDLKLSELQDMWMTFRTGNTASRDVSRDLAKAVCEVLGERNQPRKCLITDLDDTLWAGVIGEGNTGAVSAADTPASHHHHMFAKFLRMLRSEGVILALVSKNNPSDVEPYLGDRLWTERVGLCLALSDFSAVSIGWEPKSKQIGSLCRELNILPSDCVFVDNDAYELAEVQHAIPEMKTIRFGSQAEFGMTLRALRHCFTRTGHTKEDALRAQSYAARLAAEKSSGQYDTVDGFLADLDLAMAISVVEPDDLRPFELVNKTNQFNLTGKRYARDEWIELVSGDANFSVKVGLQDRFADHGIVMVALIGKTADGPLLRELVLSCRVFNRGVETAFLQWLRTRFAGDAGSVSSCFQDTGRNAPARAFLEKHGFQPPSDADPENGSNGVWVLRTGMGAQPRHFVRIEEVTQ